MRPIRTILLTLAALTATVLGGASAPALAAPQLVVFGDSYLPLTLRDGVRDWPALLQGAELERPDGLNFAQLRDHRRHPGRPRLREGDLARWGHAGRPLGNTVLFPRATSTSAATTPTARAGYKAGIDELVAAGATSRGHRLLPGRAARRRRPAAVQPHGPARLPAPADRGLGQVRGLHRPPRRRDAGGRVRGDRPSAATRARYGFTNVTTVDRARSGTTALYQERFHVGQHEQAIIADTIAARLR